MDTLTYILILLVVVLVYAGLVVLVVKKCYVSVGVDEALIKTGVGAPEVRVGGGMLVLPVVHQVERLSLVWQPLEYPFREPPMQFADQRAALTITVWIAVDSTEDAILEAAQDFGSQAGEVELLNRLYRDSIKLVIEKSARRASLDTWLTHSPELPANLWQEIQQVLEGCHVLQRGTMQPSDQSDLS